MTRKLFTLLLWLGLLCLPQQVFSLSAAADSADFVVVDLLVADPGRAFYQVTGHTGLRMQCPSEGLDYVYSFETNMDESLAGQLFKGADGRMVAIPADAYLDLFRQHGRRVRAYRLNLTPAQERRLWHELDRRVEAGPKPFNLRTTHCTSEALRALQTAVAPDVIVSHSTLMLERKGRYIDLVTGQDSPWSSLVAKTALGAKAEAREALELSVHPVAFASEAGSFVVRDRRGRESLLVDGAPQVVVEADDAPASRWPHPVVVAVVLLVLVILLSEPAQEGRYPAWARAVDTVLMAMVTIGGIAVILFMTLPSRIGDGWNWALLILNPLPLICWLLLRHRRWYRWLYTVYGASAALYLIASAFTAGTDIALCVPAGTLMLRCVELFVASQRK